MTGTYGDEVQLEVAGDGRRSERRPGFMNMVESRGIPAALPKYRIAQLATETAPGPRCARWIWGSGRLRQWEPAVPQCRRGGQAR